MELIGESFSRDPVQQHSSPDEPKRIRRLERPRTAHANMRPSTGKFIDEPEFVRKSSGLGDS